MKFPPKLHKELLDLITSRGFDPQHFSFVKRKGRIITVLRGTERSFSFISKKETELDLESGSFKENICHLIRIDLGPERKIDQWEQVRKSYLNWLDQLRT